MLSRSALAAVAFAAALVALALAYLQVRRDNGAYRDEMVELRATMTKLRSEVGGLQLAGKLEPLPAARDRGDEDVARGDRGDRGDRGEHGDLDVAAAAPAALTFSPVPAAMPQAGSFEESFRLAEEQFHGEAIDAAWAGTTTSSVQRTLAQITPTGASVRSLSCHSTRCRLEVNLRDEAQVEVFQREALYGANVLWRGQVVMSRDTLPDGSIAMVAHLVREQAI